MRLPRPEACARSVCEWPPSLRSVVIPSHTGARPGRFLWERLSFFFFIFFLERKAYVDLLSYMMQDMLTREEYYMAETRQVLSVVKGFSGGWAVARRTLDESGKEISRKELFSGFESHEAAAEMLVDLMEQEDM